MSDWKSWIIEARYLASLPVRYLTNCRLAHQGKAPVMILFYHRVADDYPNPWSISNRLFEKQINWIRRRFDIVSLAECQQRLRSGAIHAPTVTITFDDGYSDNCSQALPFLIRNKIPCTYFVTLDAVINGTRFRHDVECETPSMPNTVEEIRHLSDAGIEIGLHARNHIDFGPITDERQLENEITLAKGELEDQIGREVNYFAFPYGLEQNMNASAVRMVKVAGFHGVCSAYGDYNFASKDRDFFHLKRIHADPEMSRLKNWLTLDKRKLPVSEPTYFSNQLSEQTDASACHASNHSRCDFA